MQCASTENNSTGVVHLNIEATHQGYRKKHISYADALKGTDNLGKVSMNVGPTFGNRPRVKI